MKTFPGKFSMKTYQIRANLFYVNDGPHWFGPFRNTKELDNFYSDSAEEQWFAAVSRPEYHELQKVKRGEKSEFDFMSPENIIRYHTGE